MLFPKLFCPWKFFPQPHATHVHLLNWPDLLIVVLWKILYETMGLHDPFRVRGPVTNSLRTVLPHKQRLRGGVEEWGQGLSSKGPGALPFGTYRLGWGSGSLSEPPRRLLSSWLGEQGSRAREERIWNQETYSRQFCFTSLSCFFFFFFQPRNGRNAEDNTQ